MIITSKITKDSKGVDFTTPKYNNGKETGARIIRFDGDSVTLSMRNGKSRKTFKIEDLNVIEAYHF